MSLTTGDVIQKVQRRDNLIKAHIVRSTTFIRPTCNNAIKWVVTDKLILLYLCTVCVLKIASKNCSDQLSFLDRNPMNIWKYLWPTPIKTLSFAACLFKKYPNLTYWLWPNKKRILGFVYFTMPQDSKSHHNHIIIRTLINMHVQGHHPHQRAPSR